MLFIIFPAHYEGTTAVEASDLILSFFSRYFDYFVIVFLFADWAHYLDHGTTP